MSSERREKLQELITATAIANGDRPATGKPLDGLVMVWHFLLSHVPTAHLEPLYKHLLATQRTSYPIQPKDLLALWNDRYEEQEGPPSPGYSFFRDQWGKYLPAHANEHGVFPYGGSDWQEAQRREQELEAAYKHRHLFGLPPRLAAPDNFIMEPTANQLLASYMARKAAQMLLPEGEEQA